MQIFFCCLLSQSLGGSFESVLAKIIAWRFWKWKFSEDTEPQQENNILLKEETKIISTWLPGLTFRVQHFSLYSQKDKLSYFFFFCQSREIHENFFA